MIRALDPGVFERGLPFDLGHHALVDAETRYLVSTTRADLEWLRDAWVHSLSNDDIRRASGTVRRLLVDRTYATAWRAVGLEREPRVRAYTLDRYLDEAPEGAITWAVIGGPTGLDHQLMLAHGQAAGASPDLMDWTNEDPSDDFSLSALMESTCVYVEGVRVKRRQLIKYVANRLGGPHIGLGAAERDRAVFELLDGILDMRLLDRDAPYLIMLSIGYAVARSADLQRFVEAARALD